MNLADPFVARGQRKKLSTVSRAYELIVYYRNIKYKITVLAAAKAAQKRWCYFLDKSEQTKKLIIGPNLKHDG